MVEVRARGPGGRGAVFGRRGAGCGEAGMVKKGGVPLSRKAIVAAVKRGHQVLETIH